MLVVADNNTRLRGTCPKCLSTLNDATDEKCTIPGEARCLDCGAVFMVTLVVGRPSGVLFVTEGKES